MKIILVRHPETEALKKKIIYGATDSPLTEKGIRSMGLVREKLERTPLSAIYSSDLERTKILAAAIARGREGLTPREDARIRELDCGVYEQKSFEEALAMDREDALKFLNEFGVHRPRGGENFEDVKKRAEPFVRELIEKHGAAGDEGGVAVVSHAMTTRAIISILFGFSLEQIWHFSIRPSAIMEIEYDVQNSFATFMGMENPQ